MSILGGNQTNCCDLCSRLKTRGARGKRKRVQIQLQISISDGKSDSQQHERKKYYINIKTPGIL